MKHVIIFIGFTIVSFVFCCSSSKQESIMKEQIVFQKEPSFEVKSISFQKWIAGRQEGGSGIYMYIKLKENKNNVKLDSIFFRGLKNKIILRKEGYYSNLKENNKSVDINLSSDPKGEYGNKLTKSISLFPFQLNSDECVISYIEDGTIKYYKHSDLIKKETIAYP